MSSFNIKGFKQTYKYVLDILHHADILSNSETWFRPHEINLIHNVVDRRCSGILAVHNKCGMSEVDNNYTGRPFRGVALICRNIQGLSFSDIDVDSERITGIVMKDVNGNVIQINLFLSICVSI